LKSQLLGKLVCCEGIVTRCESCIWVTNYVHLSGSSVRPKVVKSVHFCPATKKTLERKYTDFTSYDSFPSANTYPKEVISSWLAIHTSV
jgi:DNA replication licensing factor MCM3